MEKNQIFEGMPTLLNNLRRKSFDINWPVSKNLPPLVNRSQLNPLPYEVFELQKIINESGKVNSQKEEQNDQENGFKLRKVMQITDCPHKDKKHYAKNMCSDCYSKRIKQNKVTTCGHPEKPVFARTMCLQCYTNAYRATKKKI